MTIMMPHVARVVAKADKIAGAHRQEMVAVKTNVEAAVVTAVPDTAHPHHQGRVVSSEMVRDEMVVTAVPDTALPGTVAMTEVEMEHETGLDLPEAERAGAGAGTEQLPRRS